MARTKYGAMHRPVKAHGQIKKARAAHWLAKYSSKHSRGK